MKNILIVLIEFYQNFLSFDRGILVVLAPGGACRYEVSCSEYIKQKIREVGVVRGIWFGLKRVWRCR